MGAVCELNRFNINQVILSPHNMFFRKLLSIVATLALVAVYVPVNNVALAVSSITITSGDNYDVGNVSLSVNITGGSEPYTVQVQDVVTQSYDYNTTFGLAAYGDTVYTADLPYSINGNSASPGIYWVQTEIFWTSYADYFAIFDTGVTEFMATDADSQYAKGYVDLEFTAASKNSTSFSYCLTSSVTSNAPTSGYPAGCTKSGTFNFGSRIRVQNTSGDADWSDLNAGTYYLTIKDGTNTWVSNYQTIEIVEPTTLSLNDQHVEVGTLNVTATIGNGSSPYGLSFQDVFGNSTTVFGSYSSLGSSATINDSVTAAGIYEVKATDSAAILQYRTSGSDVSDSSWVPLAIYDTGSSGILDISGSTRSFTTGSVSLTFAGAINNASSATYCLDTSITGSEADNYPTGCTKSGSITLGDTVSAYWSDISAGTYYLTLTDDGTNWATPITLTVVDPLSFSATGASSYEVGTALGATITPSGGTSPYTVKMHRYQDYSYSTTDVVTVATDITGATLLTYEPTSSGLFGFSVVDGASTSSQYGYTSSGDYGTFTIYPAGRVIMNDFSDTTVLTGTTPTLDLNVYIQSGGSSYFYCLALDANIDDTTGQVDDTANCVKSGTLTYSSSINDWTAPSSAATYQLTVQESSTSNWSAPTTITVADLDFTMNGFSDNTIDATVGDTVTIAPNIDCSSSGCSYYIHTADTVSSSTYTYSSLYSYSTSKGFDTTGWDAGTYYVEVVDENTFTNTDGTDYKIVLRDSTATTFSVSTVSTGDTKTVKPFATRDITVTAVDVDSNNAEFTWDSTVEATGSSSWSSDISVSGTTTLASVDSGIQTYLIEGSTVSSVTVTTGDSGSVTLNDEAIIKIPIDVSAFTDISNLKVYVKDGAGTISEISACDTLFTGDSSSDSSLSDKDNYAVSSGSACYVRGTVSLTNYIYIATRHFSEFVVGEGAATSSGAGNSSNGSTSSTEDTSVNFEAVDTESTTEDTVVPEEDTVTTEEDRDTFIAQNLVENRVADIDHNDIAGVEVFSDIENHWARNVITKLRKNGVLQGRAGGEFMPNAQITRAEFMKVLVLVLGLNADTANAKAFADSPSAAWFNGYLLTAQKVGLIGRNGNFRPNEYINMAEASTLLNRAVALGLVENSSLSSAVNLDVAVPGVMKGSWYYNGAKFLLGNDLVTEFKAGKGISRAQAVNMIYKLSL